MADGNVVIWASVGGSVAIVLIVFLLVCLGRQQRAGRRRGRGYFGLGEGGYRPPQLNGGDDESLRSSPSVHSYAAKIPTEKDFKLLKTLGRGSFGKVLLVRHKRSRRVFALKVVSKARIVRGGAEEVEKALLEARFLRVLTHPFLVALFFAFQSERLLFYVFEFARGGQLLFHLRRERVFSLERARFYGAEVALALEYMHTCGVVYRDLKPENLLLRADGHVCVTDFGTCKLLKMCEGGRTRSFVGTPPYMAPEIVRGEAYGVEADWYSFGVLLYELLSGETPFTDTDERELYRRVLNEAPAFPSHMDGAARDACGGLLAKQPATRLGCGEGGTETLRTHPFFHPHVDWDRLAALAAPPPPGGPDIAAAGGCDGADADVRFFDPSFTEDVAASLDVDTAAAGDAARRGGGDSFRKRMSRRWNRPFGGAGRDAGDAGNAAAAAAAAMAASGGNGAGAVEHAGGPGLNCDESGYGDAPSWRNSLAREAAGVVGAPAELWPDFDFVAQDMLTVKHKGAQDKNVAVVAIDHDLVSRP